MYFLFIYVFILRVSSGSFEIHVCLNGTFACFLSFRILLLLIELNFD